MSLTILHVIESFAPEAGSAAIPLQALVNAQRSRGDQSRVAAESARGPIGSAAPKPHKSEHLPELLPSYDIVHIHGWGYDLSRRTAKEARRSGTPYVIAPYGALTDGRYRRPSFRERVRNVLGDGALVRGASALIAINEYEARTLRDRFPGGAVEVIPPGVEFDSYRPVQGPSESGDLSDSQKILLVLGPIEPVGGGVPLLRAFAECGSEVDQWRIVFAGKETGDWRKQLEAAVRRKGGGNRVTFTHADDEKSRKSWLGRASALACVSLHPSCPTSALEGLAAGLPLLAATTVVPDGLTDSINVCEPSRTGITNGLRTLLALSTEELTTIGTHARLEAKAVLDAPSVAARLSAAYERAVGDSLQTASLVCAKA